MEPRRCQGLSRWEPRKSSHSSPRQTQRECVFTSINSSPNVPCLATQGFHRGSSLHGIQDEKVQLFLHNMLWDICELWKDVSHLFNYGKKSLFGSQLLAQRKGQLQQYTHLTLGNEVVIAREGTGLLSLCLAPSKVPLKYS